MSQINKRGPGSSGAGPILTLTGNNPVAITPDGAGNINVVGDGTTATVTGTLIDNTLTISVITTGMPWNFETVGPVQLLKNQGYVNMNASTDPEIIYHMPVDAVRGDIVYLAGGFTGNFAVDLTVGGHSIRTNEPGGIESEVFTTLVASSVTSPNDTVHLLCTNNNGLEWLVLTATGNPIYL